MIRVMLSEFIKIKRKLILFLIILGPLGVIGLQAANFGLRYDWLTSQYKEDLWGGLIGEVTMLSVPTILIGLTILTSMIANIEHQTNAWKQLVALPVSKMKIFAGKALLSFILLFMSCLFLFFGTIVLGICLRYGTDIPLLYLMKMCFFPFLAAMPFLALQTWLAISMKNQAIPLTTGILGTIVSLYATGFPDWMPLKWPWLVNEWDEPVYSVLFGIVTGLGLYSLSLIDFSRRDVK
ncbi:ABC transporter permease [Sporosarcina sp. Te-1]|uniref:ABC transporter permease n=1 Tax=Sporosarcina sp. Te-1 TaxID=2818390 RepID=UPI001A9EDE70|nr:ABC transporter permease [Sporosarcina sp. Te-1]QTD40536.1 ABC transporter permease [Sporosarcina sp. Te-1]